MLAAIMLLLDNAIGGAAELLIIAMAVHLVLHMRQVYGGRSVLILARTALLGLGTVFVYTALTLVWITVAYVELTI
jgi:hypothetical protein